MTIQEISDHLGVAKYTVNRHLKKANIYLGRVKTFLTPRRKLYWSLVKEGKSNKEIAAICGVRRETVGQALRNTPGSSKRAPRGKVVRYIELLAEGKSVTEIARECGVRRQSVWRALRRRNLLPDAFDPLIGKIRLSIRL